MGGLPREVPSSPKDLANHVEYDEKKASLFSKQPCLDRRSPILKSRKFESFRPFEMSELEISAGFSLLESRKSNIHE